MRRPVARRGRVLTLLASLTLAFGLTACGTGQTSPGDQTPAPTASPTAAPTEEDSSVTSEDPAQTATPIPRPTEQPGAGDLPTGPVEASVLEREDVQSAIAAEAERSGVAPEDVTVVGFREVTWSDGSIGCPEPGRMYTQALVPGHQLVLEVGGQQLSYHSGRDGDFFHCASPVPPIEDRGVPTTDR